MFKNTPTFVSHILLRILSINNKSLIREYTIQLDTNKTYLPVQKMTFERKFIKMSKRLSLIIYKVLSFKYLLKDMQPKRLLIYTKRSKNSDHLYSL